MVQKRKQKEALNNLNCFKRILRYILVDLKASLVNKKSGMAHLWRIPDLDDDISSEIKASSKEIKNFQKRKEKNVSFLLSAHHDPLAAVVCLSQHLSLADVNNDGESKLVIGHINDGQSGFKLKLFSKTSLVQSPSLLALPSAVVDFKISNGITGVLNRYIYCRPSTFSLQ